MLPEYREAFKSLLDAVYCQVFKEMESPDCAWMEHPDGQRDADKEDRFTGFFDSASKRFMDGEYFYDDE